MTEVKRTALFSAAEQSDWTSPNSAELDEVSTRQ